jgi:hypothetical protein
MELSWKHVLVVIELFATWILPKGRPDDDFCGRPDEIVFFFEFVRYHLKKSENFTSKIFHLPPESVIPHPHAWPTCGKAARIVVWGRYEIRLRTAAFLY